MQNKKCRKTFETPGNAAAGRTIHIKVKDLDAAADYSYIAGERMN
jgi:hypothetical protein